MDYPMKPQKPARQRTYYPRLLEPITTDPTAFPPTDALPGSERKVLVMESRAASGLPVFHPRDSVADCD